MNAGLDLITIDELTAGKLGVHDVQCPMCSRTRKPANRRKRVLRIWRLDADFASYHCAHCLDHGYAHDSAAVHLDPAKLAKARADARQFAAEAASARRRTARRLYARRRPIAGTIGERYLRDPRAYNGPLPTTMGFLPAHGEHRPAIIVPYGIPDEPEPGIHAVADAKITAVHLVLLKADGTGKADAEKPKITIGSPAGMPMVLAPMNDLLGLAVCEGVEDALTIHGATGLGAWASGGASFMPKIAAAVPVYTDAITVYAHADEDGQRFGRQLAEALVARDFEVFVEGMAS